MDPRIIGGRVRYWRERRRMTRPQFAQRVGKSVSWVEKTESGDRPLLRLPMLDQVASVLGITTDALTDPAAADRAMHQPGPAEVEAIRGALTRYEVILGAPAASDSPPRLSALAAQVDHLDSAFLACNFATIARHLPRLIVDAQRAVESADRHAAYATRLLVQAYRLASSTLLKLDANETAWLAADRAVAAAQRVQDAYCLARSTRSVARAMLSLGHAADALDAMTIMAARMEPGMGQAPEDLAAMYGMLLLGAEIAAADLGDRSTADTMHAEASRIASARFAERSHSATAFGPVNVTLHRIAAFVRLGQCAEALAFAETLPRAAVDRLPRERRSGLLLDLAAAHQSVGQYDQAAAALLEVDRVASEEVRCRPASKVLLSDLIKQPGWTPGARVRVLARQAGVDA